MSVDIQVVRRAIVMQRGHLSSLRITSQVQTAADISSILLDYEPKCRCRHVLFLTRFTKHGIETDGHSGILIIRTYALYNRSRRVLVGLLGLGATLFIVSVLRWFLSWILIFDSGLDHAICSRV